MSKIDKDEVYELKRAGLSDAEIARQLSASRERIGQITRSAPDEEKAKWQKKPSRVKTQGFNYQISPSKDFTDLVEKACAASGDSEIIARGRGWFPRLIVLALLAYIETLSK